MQFKINNRVVGPNEKPLVIAEIGINHNGDFEKAKRMILDAYNADCELVKFQTHCIEGEHGEMLHNNVIPPNAKESIYDMMVRCAFTEDQEKELKAYTEALDMIYLSTPFSRAAVDRLERLGVPAYKIGSGECNNYPLIEYICKTGKPIILSTGMNDIPSIRKAVDIIKRYNIPYALLHCTSMYPTPYNKVRLGALEDLRLYFPRAILGLSDHSLGNYTCYAAVALGACILEKHFTSDKNWPGSDVPISITPTELTQLIEGCNAVHEAMGGNKTILPEEKGVIDFAYACVVSTKPIKKGETFTEDNIWVKRPGTGELKAEQYKNIIGKTALNDIEADQQLKENDVDRVYCEEGSFLNNDELDNHFQKQLDNFLNKPDLETYKKLHKDFRKQFEDERLNYLTLNGFNTRNFAIIAAVHPMYFEIKRKWEKRLNELDAPYLKLAKFNIDDILEFHHHNSGHVTGKVSGIFLSWAGTSEICYNLDQNSTMPIVPESNPYCLEKEVIKKIK